MTVVFGLMITGCTATSDSHDRSQAAARDAGSGSPTIEGSGEPKHNSPPGVKGVPPASEAAGAEGSKVSATPRFQLGPWEASTYRYKIVRIRSNPFGQGPDPIVDEDGVETWKIGRPGADGRQQISMSSRETPTFEDGTRVEDGYIIGWEPDGGKLIKWTGLEPCSYEPPMLAIPQQPKDGFSWSERSMCGDAVVELSGRVELEDDTWSIVRAWRIIEAGFDPFEKEDRMDFDLANRPPKLYIPDGSEEVADTNPRHRID